MGKLLDGINGPADLKKIPYKELKALAQEIRQEMIDTVNKTGGHLASSLGTVELTIALHRVLIVPGIRLFGMLDIRLMLIVAYRQERNLSYLASKRGNIRFSFTRRKSP